MIYASLIKRLIAAFIDFLILTVLCTIFIQTFIMIPVALVLNLLYRPIFEASSVRGTPGKFIMEIAVVRTNGDRLSLKDAYIRYFSSYLSSFTLGIGYLMAIFNMKKKTLHDYLADTVVIEQVFPHEGLWNEWIKTLRSLGGK